MFKISSKTSSGKIILGIIVLFFWGSNNVFSQLDDDFAIAPNAVGHFQYLKPRAIFPSTKNVSRNEEMWQFRYFPLFVPVIDDQGQFMIEYDNLDEQTWYVYIQLWRDNPSAKELAYQKILGIYKNELHPKSGKYVDYSKIKEDNIYAIPVASVKVVSISGIPSDVNWTLSKSEYNSIGSSDLLKIRLKVASKNEAKRIIDKAKFLDIRLGFEMKSKKVKYNTCNISYSEVKESKLYNKLSGVGQEGYVHRNDLRELAKDITQQISIACTIEESSRQQVELGIFNDMLSAWVDNEESVDFEKIAFAETYSSNDLKPDIYEKNLNELYNKVEREKSIETGSAMGLKLGFKKFSFGGNKSENRKKFERKLQENKIKVEWNGEKYIPKSIDLIRFNLSLFEKAGTINSTIQYISENDIGQQLVDVEFDNYIDISSKYYVNFAARLAKVEADLDMVYNQFNLEIPLGSILPYGADSSSLRSSDWLPCDGRSLSKEDYPLLYSKIGYTWGGAGNNFNLPDLSGEFLRGIDRAGKRDPDHSSRVDKDGRIVGAVVGSYQEDKTKLPDNKFRTNETPDHQHTIKRLRQAFITGHQHKPGQEWATESLVGTDRSYPTSEAAGGHSHIVSDGGDQQTAPKNVYVEFLIKVK